MKKKIMRLSDINHPQKKKKNQYSTTVFWLCEYNLVMLLYKLWIKFELVPWVKKVTLPPPPPPPKKEKKKKKAILT